MPAIKAAAACATAIAALAVAGAAPDGPRKSWRGWRTNIDKRSVELREILPGGPPKDGIPAIDAPRFITPREARTWVKPNEPVISLVLGDEARAYPLQILIWHEMVNDRVSGIPVAVTFCPLCYSAIVFNRRVEGREYLFGVSGMLRHSDMIMYDRETESLWQQLTGEAIVGDLTGVTLKQLPAQMISFQQFSLAHSNGLVLSRDTGYKRDYGRNPYAGYDDVSQRPFFYRGKRDNRLPPMEKVVAVTIGAVDKAYPYSITKKLHAVNDNVDGRPIVIFHSGSTASALDAATISSSRAIGSTGVFDPRLGGQVLHFHYSESAFLDEETGTAWDITGQAIEGKLKGQKLSPITHGDYFAFAWLAFKPNTKIYRFN